jgi:hypothetical protein
MALSLFTSALYNTAKFTLEHPKAAAGIFGAGVGLYNSKSIINTFRSNKAPNDGFTPDSSYFSTPSDALKKGVQIYAENPVTALALGFAGNLGISSMGSTVSMSRHAGKFKKDVLASELKAYGREMSRVKVASSLGPNPSLLKRVSHGLKNIIRIGRADSDAVRATSKFVEGLPKDSKLASILNARIDRINKLKSLNNFASFAWLGQMAFDLSKGFFSGSQPSFNVPTARTTAMGGTFNDSSEAHTQRRRAIEAMHNSQFSGRSAFGNEASLMHA